MSRRRCIFRCKTKFPLNGLPKDEEVKSQWLQFIFKSNTIPQQYSPKLVLCSHHFTEDCFENHAQFKAGYSKRLILKEGAVPTVLGSVKSAESGPQPLDRQPQHSMSQAEGANFDGCSQAAITNQSSILAQPSLLLLKQGEGASFDGSLQTATNKSCIFARPPLLSLSQAEGANFDGCLPTATNKSSIFTQPQLLLLSRGEGANFQLLQTATSQSCISTAASTCPISPTVRDVACQTDPPKRISVGTQLSMKTLQSHFRSKGVQAKAASRDFGVCTLTFPLDSPLLFLQPTIVKRPSKRPRLSLTDEGEGPCLSMVVNESDDSI
ncbi:uncharacterized protein AB9X84_023933 [Acanthopagrus schlegelii]